MVQDSGMLMINDLGAVPTKNFTMGRMDDVSTLTGQHLVEAGYLKEEYHAIHVL